MFREVQLCALHNLNFKFIKSCFSRIEKKWSSEILLLYMNGPSSYFLVRMAEAFRQKRYALYILCLSHGLGHLQIQEQQKMIITIVTIQKKKITKFDQSYSFINISP